MPHPECPTIQLTSAELRQYDDIVGQMLLRTIHEYDLVSSQGVVPHQWTPVKRHKQMIVYRNLQGTPNPRTTLMLGIGTIKGSLEDVMDGLYCDTTEELRGVKTLLKSKFIDGAVMNASETRSPEDPYRFAGIKWFAAKAPGGITHHRDMLTYERMGTTVDENGDEIAYHILQSINRPEWPANMLRHIKRAHTSNCFLYRRKQGHVECFFLSEFHASGSAAKWFADYAIACKWLSVLRTAECAEAKKLSQLIDHARFSSYSRRYEALTCLYSDQLNLTRRSLARTATVVPVVTAVLARLDRRCSNISECAPAADRTSARHAQPGNRSSRSIQRPTVQ